MSKNFIDPSLRVEKQISINASEMSPLTGYQANLKQVMQSALSDERALAARNNKIVDDVGKIIEGTSRNLTIFKKNELENELTEVYINYHDDAQKCETGWRAAIDKAKKDKPFLSLLSDTQIETFAQEIVSKYKLQLQKETLDRRNRELTNVSIQEIRSKQNQMQMAFSALMSDDKALSEDGFRRICDCYQGINEVLDRDNYTGGKVFNNEQKLAVSINNNDILGQSFARARYSMITDISKKSAFIDSIEDGSLKIDLKTFLRVPNDYLKGKDDTPLPLDNFDFAMISPDIRYHIVKELRSKLEGEIKGLEKANKLSYAKAVSDGQLPRAPKNQTYQKCCDEEYDELLNGQILKSFISNDPRKYAQIFNVHCRFASEYNYVPKNMTDALTIALDSPDPQMFSTACQIVDYIKNDCPGCVINDKNFMKNAAFAFKGIKLMRFGMPASIVMDIIHKDKQIDKQQFKMLEQDYASHIKDTDIMSTRKLVDDAFGKEYSIFHPFGLSKDIPQDFRNEEMERQANEICQGFYIQTQDFDSAREATLMLLKQKWGITQINGQTNVVAYPAEKFYQNEIMTPQLMQARLAQFVSGFENAEKKPCTLKDVLIVPDRQTYKEIENGILPSFHVLFKNEFGTYDAYTEDGDEIRVGDNIWSTQQDKDAMGVNHVNQVNTFLKQATTISRLNKLVNSSKNFAERYEVFQRLNAETTQQQNIEQNGATNSN